MYVTGSSTPPLYELRRELSASLSGKRLLYLDLLYWNHLCDAALGEVNNPERVGLLRDLREQAVAGNVVCPIEYTTFVELYKQRLPEKRRATAGLIDELSSAVVIVSPHDRCFLETLRLVQALIARQPYPPAPRDEIWTKPAFLLSHGELKSATMPAEDLARLNALMRAAMWQTGFTQLLEQLGEEPRVSFEWAERVAKRLNEVKEEARKGFANYRAVYLAEVRGVLDASAPALGSVLGYLFYRAGGDGDTVPEQQQDSSGAVLARLLSAAFEKQDLSAQLPSVHVLATLYASVQWDAPRRFRANDIQDFAHAAAALGYCNAFATERPLATLLEQSKLTRIYQTAVLASVAEVRAWLASSTAA